MILTETSRHSDDGIDNVEGYRVYNLNRSSKREKSVCIYGHLALECTVINEFTVVTHNFKILTIRSTKSMLSVMYRPPN